MLNIIKNLIFPVNCGSCGEPLNLTNADCICPDCESELETVFSDGCCFCGRPLETEGILCRTCRGKTYYTDGFFTACRYEGNIRNLIVNFKFNGRKYLGKILGKILAETFLSKINENFDYIVPVPLSKKRLKERGYNQSYVLSKSVSEASGIEINAALLKRKKHTLPQTDLKRNQRFENIKEAFFADSKASNKKILLIDDVATTGATVQSAVSALKRESAEKVTALVLAHGK